MIFANELFCTIDLTLEAKKMLELSGDGGGGRELKGRTCEMLYIFFFFFPLVLVMNKF